MSLDVKKSTSLPTVVILNEASKSSAISDFVVIDDSMIITKQEQEFLDAIRTPELITALSIASEQVIGEIIKSDEKDKAKKRQKLCKLLEQGFMAVSLNTDIERYTLEVAARVFKFHDERFVRTVWVEETEKTRHESLETVFVIGYIDNSIRCKITGRALSDKRLIATIHPKDDATVSDLWSLYDTLLAKESRPSMAMVYLSLIRDLYHRRVWWLELERLRAQANEARAKLKQLDEKTKETRRIVIDSKAKLDKKVVSELDAQHKDVDQLRAHIQQIEDHNKKIEVIEGELEHIVNQGPLEKFFASKKAKLIQLNQELEAKQAKMNAFVEASSKYFLERLSTCEKRVAELKVKITHEDNPIKDIEKEIAATQVVLKEAKSAKLEATALFAKEHDQRMQQIKEKQSALNTKRELLLLKQKELIQAQCEAKAQSGYLNEIDGSLVEVRGFLKDVKNKGELVPEQITALGENEHKLSAMQAEHLKVQEKHNETIRQKEAEIKLLEIELSQAEKDIWTNFEKLLATRDSLHSEFIGHTKKLAGLKVKIKDLLEQLNITKANLPRRKKKHQDELTALKGEMEYLGALLSMVLNLPLDAQSRVVNLKLAKEEVTSTIEAIGAKEEKQVVEAEKQIGVLGQELTAASPDETAFKALEGEVKAAAAQLHVEAEKTKKQIKEIREVDTEAMVSSCAIAAELQQAASDLRDIRQKNETEVVAAVMLIQEIGKRSHQMQSVAQDVSRELPRIVTNLQIIKGISAEAQFVLGNPCFAKLKPYERKKVEILLKILIDLQNKQNKQQNLKSSWFSHIFQSASKTREKIDALRSTILALIKIQEESDREPFFVQCALILQWKRSSYAKYWVIGWCIDWVLSGVKAESVKSYDQSIEELGPKEAYKSTETEEERVKGEDAIYELLLQATTNAAELPNLIITAQENQEILVRFCTTKLKEIGAFKVALLELEGKLIVYRGHAISLGKICKNESIAIEVKKQVMVLDTTIADLKCLEARLEAQEQTFNKFKGKVELSADLFFKQEALRTEGEQIAGSLKQLIAKGEVAERDINVAMASFDKKIDEIKRTENAEQAKETGAVTVYDRVDKQLARLPVHCMYKGVFESGETAGKDKQTETSRKSEKIDRNEEGLELTVCLL